ncbi:conserved hypothetical protein [Roseovarius sp. EC-HK134]|jgi:hypothetical protein|uniref:Uncharacterized protein n=1 Tax=Roseovarius mucosus TaxID=215743 RepID=A0A1V0RMV2_9RHOB|nr:MULTISPECIES: hypothetical protein [Roseovarius]ARE83109.1 hypothetical protein ROSMUCSMR3_01625 [Roseovarius mucosus]AWZ20252.1 Hypothetical protein RAK1035_1541 [Roseovarius sp. AK1035]EDM29858.1 hypothetical protein RTM1035_00835 [Roseovarius sp. TM1035]MBW4974088.1 hypothetical protein [Roseovarius mucosus]VVT04889.1 conserved hypothetical protein [Roseovarius sp. EC-SD190]|tara:strand:- start:2383 stop:2529 length:147 start_codon:yes stop_codon:yes gene_type:complete
MNDGNDVKKMDLRESRKWLSGEVEIRLPKAWLAIGAAAIAVLLIVALD